MNANRAMLVAAAKKMASVFAFILAYQAVNWSASDMDITEGTGVRELSELWYSVHPEAREQA